MKDILSAWRFAKKYKRFYIIGIIVLFVVDLIQMFIPRLIKKSVDYLITGNVHISPLVKYAGMILLLSLMIGLLRYLWRQLIIGSARRVEMDIRKELFHHLISLPIPFHDKKNIGDLMAHLTNDIEAVRMAAGIAIVAIFDGIVLALMAIVMMGYISVKLTLIVMLPMPILTIYIFTFNKTLFRRFKRVQEGFSVITEAARRVLYSVRMIKAFVQEKNVMKRFSLSSYDYVQRNIDLIKIWGAFHPGIDFVVGFSFILVLVFGGKFVMTGEISLGEFIAYHSYLELLIWPMIAIGWVINLFQRGSASMRRIDDLFAEKVEIKAIEPIIYPKTIKGEIEFRNISFEYNEEKVLDNLSFSVKSGNILGITGKIGSGKSSIFALLLRFYDPNEGQVLIDGKNLIHYDIDSYRKFIGYVPQDAFLFSTTIRENIAFAKPDATEEEIMNVAKIAGIHEEIMSFPQGYDTIVGEKGVTLSGGQKQRISIARALIIKPKILLLDDALSAVDTEKEKEIIENLKEYIENMSVIIASHRISALKLGNEVIVLDKGQIVQKGNHDSLIQEEGYYRYIYKLQEVSA